MIIYGSRAKQIGKESITEKCENCGNQNAIDIYFFQKYAHIFWIPIFPIGRTGVSQCSHCKQALKPTEMPSAIKAAYQDLFKKFKTPVWMYAGLLLIGAAIIIGVITNGQERKTAKNNLQHLQPNDLIAIKTTEGHFTYLKVINVKGDSVFIKGNKMEAEKQRGLSKIKTNEEDFDEDIYYFSSQELLRKFENDTVLNVVRK